MKDKANYEKYLAKCPFEIVKKNDLRYTVMVKFDEKYYKKFIDSMLDIKLDTFMEKPFTLQDYFMSFYKEDKTFGGLGGVVGNKK